VGSTAIVSHDDAVCGLAAKSTMLILTLPQSCSCSCSNETHTDTHTCHRKFQLLPHTQRSSPSMATPAFTTHPYPYPGFHMHHNPSLTSFPKIVGPGPGSRSRPAFRYRSAAPERRTVRILVITPSRRDLPDPEWGSRPRVPDL
jgi:hypothetical protein